MAGGSGPGGMDPNMLYAAGSQLFANQAQHVINNYAQDLSSKGRSWIHHKLKYYFAVDTAYVVKKLLLLFFPFTHKVSHVADYCRLLLPLPHNVRERKEKEIVSVVVTVKMLSQEGK